MTLDVVTIVILRTISEIVYHTPMHDKQFHLWYVTITVV